MFIKKRYSYFVSYSYHNKTDSGMGNARIDRNKKITNYADISGIAEHIKENHNFENIIIVNYVLLGMVKVKGCKCD